MFHCCVPDQVSSDLEVFELGFVILAVKQNVDFFKVFFSTFPGRSGICQMHGNEAMPTWYSNPGGKHFT